MVHLWYTLLTDWRIEPTIDRSVKWFIGGTRYWPTDLLNQQQTVNDSVAVYNIDWLT